MSTLTRSESARINGAKSKGPKTAEGKERSSLNALRHGLSAQSLALTNESRARYEALEAAYMERFQPCDEVERDLVVELCAAKWLQRRCWAIETAILDFQMAKEQSGNTETFDELDEEMRTALAFMNLADNSNVFAAIHRHQTRARRSYDRALQNLELLRGHEKAILQNEPKAA